MSLSVEYLTRTLEQHAPDFSLLDRMYKFSGLENFETVAAGEPSRQAGLSGRYWTRQENYPAEHLEVFPLRLSYADVSPKDRWGASARFLLGRS
jgi:hypothetical protein